MVNNIMVDYGACNEDRRQSSLRYGCEEFIENGINFRVCNRCGWVGIPSTISKWDLYRYRGILKHYPKPKCPYCD